jgi:hypothetical protein
LVNNQNHSGKFPKIQNPDQAFLACPTENPPIPKDIIEDKLEASDGELF